MPPLLICTATNIICNTQTYRKVKTKNGPVCAELVVAVQQRTEKRCARVRSLIFLSTCLFSVPATATAAAAAFFRWTTTKWKKIEIELNRVAADSAYSSLMRYSLANTYTHTKPWTPFNRSTVRFNFLFRWSLVAADRPFAAQQRRNRVE